ncbi:hypothetical protein SARC_17618, partial [Sphaeroforma arctica JP610]
HNEVRLSRAEDTLESAREHYEQLIAQIALKRKELVTAEDDVVGGAMYGLMENIARCGWLR